MFWIFYDDDNVFSHGGDKFGRGIILWIVDYFTWKDGKVEIFSYYLRLNVDYKEQTIFIVLNVKISTNPVAIYRSLL